VVHEIKAFEMKRDLGRLADREFDLVVVGGGIYGACAAWDATQRGLAVALIDRGDFCSATSAHSFKIVHGGIRYLQHGDIFRVRQSSGERRAFLRIAPHLVRPLSIAIPTYGHAMRGKALLRAGMTLYDLLTADRNEGIRDPGRRIPPGRTWNRREILDRFPGLDPAGLTGGAVFCDGQMLNPPRLVLAFVRRAEVEGAAVANHVEATGFVIESGRVRGVRARDALTGVEFVIRSRMVLNATGPYAERLLATSLGRGLDPAGTYSRDACFVVKRRVVDHALAVQGATRDPDAVLSRGERHLFLVPWRAFTLVGVWHVVYGGDPDSFTVTEGELQRWIDEMNAAYPGAALTLDDVSTWNAGLVPFGENEPGAGNLRYGHRSRLVDHEAAHGLHGLVTLIGIRYTTGRYDAARSLVTALSDREHARVWRRDRRPRGDGAGSGGRAGRVRAAAGDGPRAGLELRRGARRSDGPSLGRPDPGAADREHADDPRSGRPCGPRGDGADAGGCSLPPHEPRDRGAPRRRGRDGMRRPHGAGARMEPRARRGRGGFDGRESRHRPGASTVTARPTSAPSGSPQPTGKPASFQPPGEMADARLPNVPKF
jgi:glycerol-3-phosphate dehydrogenase